MGRPLNNAPFVPPINALKRKAFNNAFNALSKTNAAMKAGKANDAKNFGILAAVMIDKVEKMENDMKDGSQIKHDPGVDIGKLAAAFGVVTQRLQKNGVKLPDAKTIYDREVRPIAQRYANGGPPVTDLNLEEPA